MTRRLNELTKLNFRYLSSRVVPILLTGWFVLFALPDGLYSQSERSWPELMADPEVNFYDVQETFRQAWEGREVEKGKGFMAYKRWEWFMEPRVFPSGDRFPGDAVMRAIEENPQFYGLSNSLAGDWTYIGNTGVPTGGGGAGRVNSVRTATGSANELYACAPAGGLWKTTNGGSSWSLMNTDFLASIGVSDVAVDPTNPNIIYIATGDGDAGDTYSIGVWKSVDGGQSWAATGLSWNVSQARTTNRILIHPGNPSILIVATSNGLYRTTNAGASWSQVQTGNFKDLTFKPGNPDVVYACTNRFFRSINGGASWTLVSANLPSASQSSRLAIAVSAADPEVVYVLAGGSNQGFFGFYRSTDSGGTFSTRSTSPNLLGWSSVGNDSGGQAWFDLRVVADPVNANIVYTGGVNVWKSTNGGSTWTCNAHWYGAGGLPYVHADIHAMYFVPGTSTLLIGCDGGVYRTTNGGSSYSDISSNLQIGQQYRLGISALNSNLILTGWQDNGTNRKSGNNHARVIGGDGMECAIDPTSNSVMYGELYYGNILKSTNGGNSFSSTIANSDGSAGTVHEQGAWVTPFLLGSNPQHIFVGKTRVYRSTNGGTSFTALGAMGSGRINALAVAPSNNNVIYASKGATFYRSSDGNAFTTVSGMPGQSITYIAVHPSNPDKIWVTFSGFSGSNKVYHSTNGGSTWVNQTGNLPNLPVNCVVYCSGTNDGVYVGTDAGVFYRDADLGNWIPYMNGLPHVVVNELEIHYGSGTITAATFGRGTWRAPLHSLEPLDAVLAGVVTPSGTLCVSQFQPQLTIQNAGTETISSLSLEYGVIGSSIQTYQWTGNLTPGQSTAILLPLLSSGEGSFSFHANILLVNGVNDGILGNNSLTSSFTVALGPVNDVCASAIPLVVNASPTSANNSVTCADGPDPSCGGTGIRDLWFSFVYAGGNLTIETTLGTNADTRIALFSACGGSQLGCNDDASGIGLASRITMACGSLNIGQTYYIQAGGWAGVTGSFTIRVTSDALTNDLCSGAIPVPVMNESFLVNTSASCQNGINPVCGGTQIQDSWYRFVYSAGPLTISTSGPGTLTDTRLAVYTACGNTLIACDDDDGPGTYSTIQFGCTPGNGLNGANEATVLTPGQTYYLQVGGANGLTGSFWLTLQTGTVSGCTSPSACNYNPCANSDDGSCQSAVWYYLDNDGDGYGDATTGQLFCIAPEGYVSNSLDCQDDNPQVYPGAEELCNGQDDNCNGFADEGCVPSNDAFASAQEIVLLPLGSCQGITASLALATSTESTFSCPGCPDVWYQFTATSRGVRVVCDAPTFNALIELYDAEGQLIVVANSNSGFGNEVLHEGLLAEGSIYFLRVASSGASGSGMFSLCLNALEKSRCDMSPGPYSLCQFAKAYYVGAHAYGFRFVSQLGGGVMTAQSSGGSTLVRLEDIQGLRYGHAYSVTVDAGYILPDAFGNQEMVWVIGNQSCPVTTSAAPSTSLRPQDSCPIVRYPGQTVACHPHVCAVTSYQWQFTQTDVVASSLFIQGVGATRFALLDALSGLSFGGTYSVRVRPIFSYGAGIFGSATCLTLGESGMMELVSVLDDNERSESDGVQVYPNPTDGNQIRVTGTPEVLSSITSIRITDSSGRLVLNYPVKGSLLPSSVIEFPRLLESGLYFVHLQGEAEHWVRSLVVRN